MNKSDLIQTVANEMKTSKADAARYVEAILGAIESGLRSQEKVTLSGFGTFVKRSRPARKGVSPVTKQPIEIPPTVTCGFKPSAQLRESIGDATEPAENPPE